MDEETPTITTKIGTTTYDIHVFFSETSKETFTDKVLRLIQNEAIAG
ncbi:MAG: transposon-encoded TnpW family protein [Clostridiales bacterium]|nr:transposon-encoded TnpW family protein [Clostridiales bacterium]